MKFVEKDKMIQINVIANSDEKWKFRSLGELASPFSSSLNPKQAAFLVPLNPKYTSYLLNHSNLLDIFFL